MSRPDVDQSDTVQLTTELRTRRRHRRQTLTFLGLFAFVAVVGLFALGNSLQWWRLGGRAEAAAACPAQAFSAPELTEVNVYNATSRRGLASAVAAELQRRGFHVLAIETEVQAKPVTVVVLIRYGAAGKIYAHTLARQFPGSVRLVKDARTSRKVDVLIGAKYQRMVSRNRAAAEIVLKPQPADCAFPRPSARSGD